MSSSEPQAPPNPSEADWVAPAEAMISADDGSASTPVVLTIEAQTAFTEIRLLDARFAPVLLPANAGTVTLKVPPGIYEVGFRIAEGWQTVSVVLEPGASLVTIAQDASPPDVTLATVATDVHGEASVIIDLTQRVASLPGSPGDPDGEQITVQLIGADDNTLVSTDLTPQTEGVWQFAAEPGFWRLRIDEQHPREPFELPLTVVPHYVAFVAAPLRETGVGKCVDAE